MNFFKYRDAFRISSESEEASQSGLHSEVEPAEAPPPEPTELGEWSEALAESDPAPVVRCEDPIDPLLENEPGAGEELLPEVDRDEADNGAKRNPFEARLASLRLQLQEGPRLVLDTPVRVEADPDPVKEPEPSEPAKALAPEPVSEILAEKARMALAQEPASVVTDKEEALCIVADAEAEMPPIPSAPEPSVGPGARRAGRVKTRLLGFERGASNSNDPLGSAAKQESPGRFPVGWIVVVKGPGRGASFCLYNGLSQIGRSSDQTVCLDFGDTSISRENHAVVAYDSEQKKHFLGHGGKANIVRLNDMPVLSTEELSHGDQIRIGETTLRFVALCGAGFDWSMSATDDDSDAAAI
jgi:hypothetical protein